jgi:hypothetical protein
LAAFFISKVEVTHTQLLNTNQELSMELEKALSENKLLKKQINKLKLFLDQRQISLESVLGTDNSEIA